MNSEEQETVAESLEVIESEASSNKPKKSMLKTAIATLKSINSIAEFSEAVTALATHVGSLIG